MIVGILAALDKNIVKPSLAHTSEEGETASLALCPSARLINVFSVLCEH